MTNEQLTQNIVELLNYKAKAEEEHKMFESMLKAIQEDIKTTKNLTEDVHIMAINMENMQKVQDEMNKKVDALTSKEFLEFKETKKLVKQNIISKITGGIVGAALTVLVWILTVYFAG